MTVASLYVGHIDVCSVFMPAIIASASWKNDISGSQRRLV
jgi:hypothetical protein